MREGATWALRRLRLTLVLNQEVLRNMAQCNVHGYQVLYLGLRVTAMDSQDSSPGSHHK